ncbi:hypothetical protein Tco_0753072 [Tanacetum coccineum]
MHLSSSSTTSSTHPYLHQHNLNASQFILYNISSDGGYGGEDGGYGGEDGGYDGEMVLTVVKMVVTVVKMVVTVVKMVIRWGRW